MKYNVLGVEIDSLTNQALLTRISEWLSGQERHWLVTANPEIILKAKDETYRQILNSADLRMADGIGLVFAIKYLYRQTVERITGVDLAEDLFKLAEQKNYSIYFLGGLGDVASQASRLVKQRYPNLRVVGAAPGGIGEQLGNHLAVISLIKQAAPDILLVAFGAPSQEKWIAKNLRKLLSVKLAVGVGGAFDFLAKKVKRAPARWRKIGLEWLWRLLQQPQRARRIFNAVVVFSFKVYEQKIKNR